MFNFINEILEKRRQRKRKAMYAKRDNMRDMLDKVLCELFRTCPAVGKQILSVSCRFRQVYRRERECEYIITLADGYSVVICHKQGWDDMFMTHYVEVYHEGKRIRSGEYDATGDPLYPCSWYKDKLWNEQENVRTLYGCLEAFVAEGQTKTF